MIYFHPAIRPRANFEKSILSDIPIGTDIDTVMEYIKSKEKWGNVDFYKDYGYLTSNSGGIVGTQYIRLDIGTYNLLFTTVTLYLGFDEEKNLVGINIVHYVDAP